MEPLNPNTGRPIYKPARDLSVRGITIGVGQAVGRYINSTSAIDIGDKKLPKDFEFKTANGKVVNVEIEIKKTLKVSVDPDGFPRNGADAVGKKRDTTSDYFVQYVLKSGTLWVTDKATMQKSGSVRKDTTYQDEPFTEKESFCRVQKKYADLYKIEGGQLLPISKSCKHGFLENLRNEDFQSQSQSQSVAG